jgi:peptidoglycan hydrolase-like protein with peptidoglycan-binding domain
MGQAVAAAVLLFFIGGCASAPRRDALKEDLKNQIIVLENQLAQKDAEIESLRQALVRKTEEKAAVIREMRGSTAASAQPSVRQIQTALKNAGFYTGAVDGRSGNQTRSAIKEFQKASKLEADGKVGKQTWKLLEPYLYQSAAQ